MATASSAPARKRKRAADALTEVASLAAGDLVVHVDHGIGRFAGLRTIEAAGAPHDCLEILYAGNDRLFLPVENIELLTRYGAEGSAADLDRLGGVGWQNRKARLKKRIRDMAEQLIKTAAARLMRAAPALPPPAGLYDEFAARFPYEETDDQMAAIEATLDDLAAGRPMDRLICGDVGFGKTEVALRAAFVAAMNGKQVALVVPTTLLARQHSKTFTERFRGLPIEIGQASRLVGSAELARVKKGIADGTIDIAIGTHALLGKAIEFKDLGLLIVDEEQHFGVKHKERLKELRANVHVLTLSATPIPRTLQLALTGVRDLSMIATPPIDRLAVRTFIAPFDTLTIREALLRERLRGGQSFFVVPRISDLAEIKEFLEQNMPEAKVGVAHGQMPPSRLDQVMNAFYDGQYDILLSTTIVESGLDIPTRQHADRPPRRHVRPGAALPAPRPHRPLEAPRLFALHRAGDAHADRDRRAAAESAAIARHARRRLPARQPRPRHPRRRQSSGRRAVRPHQGGRLRALPADAGGGGREPESRRRGGFATSAGRRRSPSAWR